MRRASGIILSILLAGPACVTGQEPGEGSRLDLGSELYVGPELPELPHVEPVIAVNPDDPDEIVVASIVVRAPRSEDEFHDSWTVHVLRSRDGGSTWTRHRLPGLEETFSGDPWLAWAEDGTLILSVLAAVPDPARGSPMRALLYESGDDGRTWTGPVEVPTRTSTSLDHPVIDVARGRRFVFASGDLPAIVVARTSEAGDGLEALPEFRPDTLNGFANNNLGDGVGFPDGRFVFSYFSMAGPQPSALRAVRPTADGRHYEVSVITDEHIPVGFPRMAVDRSSGDHRHRVYSVWVRSDERPDVMIAHSDDFGASWSPARRVQSDSSIALRTLPVVGVDRAGNLLVAWVDGRHGEGDCWDVYAAVSLDGGSTFKAERRFTKETTCPRAPDNRSGGAAARWRWGGDYIGVDAAPDGGFFLAWSDSRTGIYQLYARRVAIR